MKTTHHTSHIPDDACPLCQRVYEQIPGFEDTYEVNMDVTGIHHRISLEGTFCFDCYMALTHRDVEIPIPSQVPWPKPHKKSKYVQPTK